MEGVSYVLHQAALPSAPLRQAQGRLLRQAIVVSLLSHQGRFRSIAAPMTSHQANATGIPFGENVLLAARDAGIPAGGLAYASDDRSWTWQ